MKAKVMRWGLNGYGDLARKRVAAALKQAEGSELAAICGRDLVKARSFAREYDISFAGSSVSDLVRGEVDAVYVCTPVDTHFAYALEALNAGKHVLVVKPMAASVAECEKLIHVAEQNNLVLGVAYYRREFPKSKKVKKLIEDGFLGQPVWINIAAHSWYNPGRDDPKYWRVQTDRSGGGGALTDIGVHRLDLVRYWMGDFKVEYANRHNLVHDYEVEDGCSAVFELANGAPVHAYFSWNTKTWIDRFEIVGSEGKIIADPLDGPNLTLIRGRDREVVSFPVPENAHLPCVENFVVKDGEVEFFIQLHQLLLGRHIQKLCGHGAQHAVVTAGMITQGLHQLLGHQPWVACTVEQVSQASHQLIPVGVFHVQSYP